MGLNLCRMRKVRSLRQSGLLNYQCGYFDGANVHYTQALDILKKFKTSNTICKEWQYDLLQDLAYTSLAQRHLEDAQDYCNQAQEMARIIDDQIRLAKSLDCQGEIQELKTKVPVLIKDMKGMPWYHIKVIGGEMKQRSFQMTHRVY